MNRRSATVEWTQHTWLFALCAAKTITENVQYVENHLNTWKYTLQTLSVYICVEFEIHAVNFDFPLKTDSKPYIILSLNLTLVNKFGSLRSWLKWEYCHIHRSINPTSVSCFSACFSWPQVSVRNGSCRASHGFPRSSRNHHRKTIYDIQTKFLIFICITDLVVVWNKLAECVEKLSEDIYVKSVSFVNLKTC